MESEFIIQPKAPASKDWEFYDYIRVHLGFPAKRYISRFGHVAISAVETPSDHGGEHIGPEYHVSISSNGGRVPAEEVPGLLAIFGMLGADEDNHVSGKARHFWEPVDEKFKGCVCPCKDTEHAITEGDFTWRSLE